MWDFITSMFKLALSLAMFASVVFTLLRLTVVDEYAVPHNGMAPTILAGDSVLLWRGGNPDTGNIMLCEHPANPDELVLARVIAFSGQLVHTDMNGQLFVDDTQTMTASGRGDVSFFDATRNKMFTMTGNTMSFGSHREHEFFVERGHPFQMRRRQVNQGVFLLGDNRADPYDDSREFGEVDPEKCKGQVFMRSRPAPERDDDLDGRFYIGWLD